MPVTNDRAGATVVAGVLKAQLPSRAVLLPACLAEACRRVNHKQAAHAWRDVGQYAVAV